ncbi:chymotrypsin-2 [Drosophila takahashii]|uniref:chymotrypsin-2 n=1 Tax=Drosophila takahashii TaxID=29030 RepID=UPI001CF894F8|nr:chymotrypsin-2 [Drosophila takahashii]
MKIVLPALLPLKTLFLLLIPMSTAHWEEQGQGLRRNLYITGDYHQNVVSIRTRKHIRNWGDNHFCAGSILSARWVVTSGCCVSTLPASTPNKSSTRKNIKVVVFTRKRLKKPLRENVFKVEKVVLGKASDGECSKLALLKLEKAITGQRFAIKLPKEEMNSTWLCRTLGWGRMYYNGPYSNELLQLRTQKSSAFNCKKDCNSCLCMGSFTGKGNMCQLDRGSPLFCGHIIYGVARQSHTCQDESFMVYTSIFHQRKFIEDTLSRAPSPEESRQILILIVTLMLPWSLFNSFINN